MYIKCQVCGSKCKNVNHLIFLGLYGAWWLSVTKKKKIIEWLYVRSLVLSSLLMSMPGDVWIASLEIIHMFLVTSQWLCSKAPWSACIIDCLPEVGVLLRELKSLSDLVYTLGFLYKGNYLSYIWPVSYADIATLVHNYSWKRECTFSWCVLVSIWENLNQ